MMIISIQFSNDSRIRAIEKEAFSNSLFESISIPSKVTKIEILTIPSNVNELKDGWCSMLLIK